MIENTVRALTLCVPGLLLGCAAGVDDEMLTYVDDIKARPGGRIEALPQIKPYETFVYAADQIRSPFSPGRQDSTSMTGPKPMQDRSKEYLEQFPLDTLAMVGTLDRKGIVYALVRTQDGMVHRVTPGNYVGQNDGRVLAVDDSGIRLEELVSNGIGSFYKRSAEIGLND